MFNNNQNIQLKAPIVEASKPIIQTDEEVLNNINLNIDSSNMVIDGGLQLNLLDSSEELSEYTVLRIMKWLEEIENCPNMIKPPSQLAWSNSLQAKQLINETNQRSNLSGEYCLSDYDSIDDQIIEYNRIVDKTFHIVHDDD